MSRGLLRRSASRVDGVRSRRACRADGVSGRAIDAMLLSDAPRGDGVVVRRPHARRRPSTGRRNGEVRVQGQHDGRRAAVGHGFLDRIIGKRVPVPHRDVTFIFGTQSVLEQASLFSRVLEDGRAAADAVVGRPRFGRSPFRYEPCNCRLEAR